MAKRPLGLSKAKKDKKPRPEEASSSSENEGPDLQIDVEEGVEDEALAEVYGLFKTFDGSPKTNPKMALGLVHECDSLLRERKKLPGRFHLCYGLALKTLAGFQDDSEAVPQEETPEAFLDVALHRFDVGLEEAAAGPEVVAALCGAKAATLVAKFDERLRASKSQSRMIQADMGLIEDAQKLATRAGKSAYRQAEAVAAIQQVAVMLEGLPQFAEKYAELLAWCGERWSQVSESGDEPALKLAWQGLGELALAEGQMALAAIIGEEEGSEDEGEDDVDIHSPEALHVRATLTKAVGYLERVEDAGNPEVLVQIAEAKISLGNVSANESEEQEQLYREAVVLLKKSQRLGAGDYQTLIDSLEA